MFVVGHLWTHIGLFENDEKKKKVNIKSLHTPILSKSKIETRMSNFQTFSCDNAKYKVNTNCDPVVAQVYTPFFYPL